MRNLAALHKFGIRNSITNFLLFTLRPRLIALSSFLFAAVSTQTFFIRILIYLIAELPVTFDVVLWYGSAGRLFGIPLFRVFSWPRPVAVLIGSCHTEVLTFIIKPFLAAWTRVPVDWFVLATIPDSTGTSRTVVIPEFTTLGTFDISAFALSEAWGSFSPCEHATASFVIACFVIASIVTRIRATRFFIFFIWIVLGRKSPLYSTDSGAGWAAGLCACVSQWVIAVVQAVGADGHCHVHVKLITQSIKVAVCQWTSDVIALLY